MFEGNWLEVNPHDYLFAQEDGETCTLLIMPVDSPMNILGMPLYLDYYTIHDPEVGTIGFAPNTGSEKETVKRGSVPPSSQFLEVRLLPAFPLEPINITALASAWAVTLIFMGLWYQGWKSFAKPTWVETLDTTRYIVVTVLLILFTLIVSIFSIQPILYLLIKEN